MLNPSVIFFSWFLMAFTVHFMLRSPPLVVHTLRFFGGHNALDHTDELQLRNRVFADKPILRTLLSYHPYYLKFGQIWGPHLIESSVSSVRKRV